MTQAEVMSMLNSGAFDKILALFGKKETGKEIVSSAVEDYSALKDELAEVKGKLDAIMQHLGITVIKERYTVVKDK